MKKSPKTAKIASSPNKERLNASFKAAGESGELVAKGVFLEGGDFLAAASVLDVVALVAICAAFVVGGAVAALLLIIAGYIALFSTILTIVGSSLLIYEAYDQNEKIIKQINDIMRHIVAVFDELILVYDTLRARLAFLAASGVTLADFGDDQELVEEISKVKLPQGAS